MPTRPEFRYGPHPLTGIEIDPGAESLWRRCTASAMVTLCG
jgi:hypothetical protein